ncbi:MULTISPECIES: hypothetical protein [Neisseriaceae]|uniref:Lipoprotein n=2 Tax=Neisseriaceae TaxID=481 RepID=A0A378US14_BERDE|nr:MULTISPECIES: hypothetical protein [Neisseriaceae]QEY23533.1 hypothetical protein D0T90_02635 [Neisseria animalis]ROW32133.1 hypothetical protein CGZ60_06015 [Neisseria animalis]STZ74801.1 Uncharacterised protein [Bergeriella denitrificans]STZ77507.1 Uncharacterised protein [Bergeriella denitrificans]STZ83021.1 Uncharacterised protein [Bergeriella denitrificans]
MSAKRLITAYILLLWLAVLAIFSACSPQGAAAAEAAEAHEAWEKVYGGMNEAELMAGVVYEPIGGCDED